MLDSKIAYMAMFEFLRCRYERLQKPDELGSLLGDLSLLDDGISADPASTEDWKDALKVVIEAERSGEGYRPIRFRLDSD